jgi:septum formation protein
MMKMSEIILASQSPRRKQLLEWAEIPFRVVVQPTAETYPNDLSVAEIPIYIAQQKAIAVKNHLLASGEILADTIVLAADTIVVINKAILNKPIDRDEAIAMLSKLSGNEHRVITGVVLHKNKVEKKFSVTTLVKFHPLTQDQICFYVDHYQPYDKAGAYAIQEWIGVTGIAAITGDFYNVMGLPVSTVVQELYTLNS